MVSSKAGGSLESPNYLLTAPMIPVRGYSMPYCSAIQGRWQDSLVYTAGLFVSCGVGFLNFGIYDAFVYVTRDYNFALECNTLSIDVTLRISILLDEQGSTGVGGQCKQGAALGVAQKTLHHQLASSTSDGIHL